MTEELEKREKKVLDFFKTKTQWIYGIILALIIYFGA
ncbi:unnamed protein product, partial [marine sediment metagenome]